MSLVRVLVLGKRGNRVGVYSLDLSDHAIIAALPLHLWHSVEFNRIHGEYVINFHLF
jgi:hypothetical protein